MSRRLRIAAAIVLVGAGVTLAALAGAAGRLAGDLRHDDAAFASDPATPSLWAARTSRADRLVRDATGLQDELVLRRAESAFVRSRGQAGGFDEEMQRLSRRGEAESRGYSPTSASGGA